MRSFREEDTSLSMYSLRYLSPNDARERDSTATKHVDVGCYTMPSTFKFLSSLVRVLRSSGPSADPKPGLPTTSPSRRLGDLLS